MKLSKRKVDEIMARKSADGLAVSYRWLAARLGISSSTLCDMFRRPNNRPTTIGRIAGALGVDIDAIRDDV